MAVVASKYFALNLVEVNPDGRPGAGKIQPYDDRDARIASLESQLESINQWKQSFSPTIMEIPGSPATLSSVDSILDDLPVVETRPSSIASSDAAKVIGVKPQTLVNAAPEDNSPEGRKTSRIMAIIQGYGQNEENEANVSWLGRVKFEPIVRSHVDKGVSIPFVLPAFPWKSVNKVEKVIGAVPDIGEEFGLGRLNNLCEDIKDVYEPGAFVIITSDGLVYNGKGH